MENKLSRFSIFGYGVICYLTFCATFTYLMGFVNNLLVPRSLDSAPVTSLPKALLINILLLAFFGLQHSGMARSSFKEMWTKIVPQVMERSTYVLFSSLCLIMLMAFWQPIGVSIWNVENPILIYALYGLSGLGWVLVFASTFMINHFDLFGLRQVYLNLKGEDYTQLDFVTPSFYQIVRHPLYVGMLFAMWFAPTMTISHLVFAMLLTIYILGAIQFEEKDLVEIHGEDYRQYKKRVPMIIPKLFGKDNLPSSNEE